ncbi:ShlB/FhaC/HecB family hemolysin secretion/activation protein [Pseudophaeobacter sp. C1-32P7]|uniref:ShlB/FhaC/HecB family hemolysin secretion/activation protein n=1 Tax=Pseudophaeobacter sp. C1-32P7 TaxID=3098142 RepID=UPI0034D52B42
MKMTKTPGLLALLYGALLALVPAPPVTAQQGPAPQLGALSGEEALLPRLNGLALVARAPGTTASRQTGVQISLRLEVPDEAALAARLQDAIGRPASLESLHRLVAYVRLHFREAGYPFTLVTLPQQDITHGSVAILVQPSLLAQAPTVDGAEYFEAESYRRAIRVQPGQTINAETLEADVALLNANPYRDVRLVSSPGQEPATTALTLVTQEQRPYDFTLGFSTDVFDGEASTNLNGSAIFGNVLGRGDVLRYDLGADPDNSTSIAHTLTFSHFLRGGRRLQASAYYTKPKNEFSGVLRQVQSTGRFGLTYHAPGLGTNAGEQQDWYVGVEVSSEEYELQFAGIPVSRTDVDLAYLKAGWSRARRLERGQRSYGLDLLLSPGDFSGGNSDARFNAARSGATADYAILRPRFSQSMALPVGGTWSIAARGQIATGKLLQSQQFNAVSGNAVRFGDVSVYGDHGLALQNTLTVSDWTFGNWRFTPQLMGDVAAVRWTGNSTGALRNTRLAVGLGAGINADISGRATLSLNAGRLWWQTTNETRSEFCLSFSLSVGL